MRALVTGGTGFVGPHLIAHLVDAGDDVLEPGDENGDFDIENGAAIDAAFVKLRPEVVYHLAARSSVAASWKDPISFLRTNVEGTQHVLDAARAHSVQRVLVVGSSEEYGRVEDGSRPVHEDTPLRPNNPYGVSKVAASYLALQAWLGTGLETIRVRTFTHTGPGQSDAFFVPAFARRVVEADRNGHDAIRTGALDPVRDLLDVRDVVRAYRLLVERGDPGEVYNVCSGVGVAIGDVAHALVARASRPLAIEPDPELMRPTEVPVLTGDPSKLKAATGWSPEFTLDATLDAVYAEASQF
jgi:GDP-4-dehydro-6-deoxy-D-mannose reductase